MEIPKEVATLARLHGVAPLLHERLRATGRLPELPAETREILGAARRLTAFENLRHYAELRRIAKALNGRGIPLIALKGLHLAELVYVEPSLRPMSDMDILVPRERVAEVIAAMQMLGYGSEGDLSGAVRQMLDSKCNLGFAHRRHDVYVEVHWTLSEPDSAYAAPLDQIWARSQAANLGGAEARVMSPEFLLVYVCAHLACNHAFSLNLRALCDISAIVDRYAAIDWDAVIRIGSAHGWRRGVAATLQLAQAQLAVPVPEWVLEALGADRIEPTLLSDALEQILCRTELPRELRNAPNVMGLTGKSVGGAFATVWRRLFVSRAELALAYGIPVRSPALPLWYALRLRDLVRKYAVSAWTMTVADPRLTAAAARHVRLARWVSSG